MEKDVEREFERVDEKMTAIKQEFISDIKDLRRKEDTHDNRIRTLETRTTIAEGNIQTLCEDVRSIKGDTRWILRLIIGAIVLALLGLILVGG